VRWKFVVYEHLLPALPSEINRLLHQLGLVAIKHALFLPFQSPRFFFSSHFFFSPTFFITSLLFQSLLQASYRVKHLRIWTTKY
jgi:hypothetical protein